jgi:hypothetical protein
MLGSSFVNNLLTEIGYNESGSKRGAGGDLRIEEGQEYGRFYRAE